MAFRTLILDATTLVAATAAVGVSAAYLWNRTVEDPFTKKVDAWEAVGTQGHSYGPRDATVTIVYFLDYQCPACRELTPHLHAVLKAHQRDLRVVYRHWPLQQHEAAYDAAIAAECASDQGRFEAYHDLLISSDSWHDLDSGRFSRLAQEADVPDIDQFSACVVNREPAGRIEADIADARSVGGRGTPTVLVNDRLINTAWDSVSLEHLVAQML